jgi:hypothetical protein
LKDAICGKKFDDDEEVTDEEVVATETYGEGIQALTPRWRKGIDSEGD